MTAAVESFYAAIKKGDAAAAMSLIAPDAVFVESGKLETCRTGYKSNHLPADIEFEGQVDGKRRPMQVTFNGDTAWVIALTKSWRHIRGQPGGFHQRAAGGPDAGRGHLAHPVNPLVFASEHPRLTWNRGFW